MTAGEGTSLTTSDGRTSRRPSRPSPGRDSKRVRPIRPNDRRRDDGARFSRDRRLIDFLEADVPALARAHEQRASPYQRVSHA